MNSGQVAISDRTRQLATWRIIADVARHHPIASVRTELDSLTGAEFVVVEGQGDDAARLQFFIHPVFGIRAHQQRWTWADVLGFHDPEEMTERIWAALPLSLADYDRPSNLAKSSRMMATAFELLSMDIRARWWIRQGGAREVPGLLEQTNGGSAWLGKVSTDDLWFLFKDEWVICGFDLQNYRVATPELTWDLAMEALPQETFVQSVAEIVEEWLI